MHRARKYGKHFLLSRTYAASDQTVKQEQEQTSRNHLPALFAGLALQPGLAPTRFFSTPRRTFATNSDLLPLLAPSPFSPDEMTVGK